MPATGFTTGRRQAKRPDLVPMSDVLRFCRGAAQLALPGPAWDAEDRADVAAELAADVWRKAVAMRANGAAEEIAPSSLGGPAPKMPKRKVAKRTPRERITVDAVPAELVKTGALYGAASNIKRARVAERERLIAAGAERARAEGFKPSSHGAYPEGVPADPAAAHVHARQILSDLGAARLGRLYPVAYGACREAAGMTGREVAAELGIAEGSLKAYRSTAAKLLPSAAVYSPLAHANTLRVDYWAPPLRTVDATLPESLGERMAPGDAFPNVPGAIVPAAPVAAAKLAGRRRRWNGQAAADWTRNLSAPIRGKLAHAAQRQRERAAEKTAEQRAADRLAAGIPAPRGRRDLAPRDLLAPVPAARYAKGARVAGPNIGGAKRTHAFRLPAVADTRRRNGAGVGRMPERTPGACQCERGACPVHTWRQPEPNRPVHKAPRTAESRRVARDLLAAEQARQTAKRAKRTTAKRASRPVPQAPAKRRPVARYGACTPWHGQRVVRRAEQAPQASPYARACHAERRELAAWAREQRAAQLAEAAQDGAAQWEARA